MTNLIQNLRFANQTVLVSREKVDFNADGIGIINSEELFKELLTFPHFSPVTQIAHDEQLPEGAILVEGDDLLPEGAILGENIDVVTDNEESDENKVPELVGEAMTHAELDAKAKQLGVDVKGMKNKDEKIKAINEYIMSNF